MFSGERLRQRRRKLAAVLPHPVRRFAIAGKEIDLSIQSDVEVMPIAVPIDRTG